MVFQKQRHAHIATYVAEIFKHDKVLYTGNFWWEKNWRSRQIVSYSPMFTDTLKMYLA